MSAPANPPEVVSAPTDLAAPTAAAAATEQVPQPTTTQAAATTTDSTAFAVPEKGPKAKKKTKLAAEPHGYVATKVHDLVTKFRQLFKRGSPGAATTTAAVGGAAGAESDTKPAADQQPKPEGAAAPSGTPAATATATAPAAPSSSGPLSDVAAQLHHHEPADQLGKELTTTEKVRNAVVSTVEHALDEAAAVKSAVTGAVAEEMQRFKEEAHHPEQQQQPHTSGGLPITSS